MKYEIDSLEGVPEALHAEYTKGDDGKYRLNLEGGPPPKKDTELEERLRKLEENNQALLDEKRKAKEEAQRAKEEAAKKSGDTASLEKSWQEKIDALEADYKKQLDSNNQVISSLTVGSAASRLAAEVFGEHADIMMPHVNKRLTYEVVEGKPTVRVMGDDGKPTAKSIEELKTEFQNNEKFAPFVVGSRASGSGGHGGTGNGPTKKFSEMNGAELKELREKDPAGYDRLKSAE